MLNMSVHLFRVTVTFNPSNPDPLQKIVLISDDFKVDTSLNHRRLPIPQGIALIVFDLITLPGGEALPAEFAPEPLTWFGTGDPPPPIDQPAVFLVQAFHPNHLTIVDFNTVKVENSHPFNVNVLYDGVPYSSDPVIVNEPPMQPGQG